MGLALGVAALAAACSPRPTLTSEAVTGQERMPAPAGVWLTADPVSPSRPVKVEITSLEDPQFHREHTFAAGEALRGTSGVSSGRYRLTGLDGACVTDLFLGPSREADVEIRLEGETACSFRTVLDHGIDEVTHDDPAVLIGP